MLAPSEHHLTTNRRWHVILAFLVLFLFLKLSAASSAKQNSSTIPAVIVFGDSIVDPGNNNGLKTVVKCNFQPYGKDFKGGQPTGRFTNGKVPSDLLAEAFGVKEYVPAYLDPNLKFEDLLTGVSFASGASGYDPLTPKILSVLSLSDQLELYKEYVTKIKKGVGEERAASIVSESLYGVVCGSDDIANTYFSTPFRRSQYDVPSYTDLMATSASNFIQELYGLGARKIGVLSLPPVGCVPSQRTLQGGVEKACSEPENQAAKLFNSKLSSAIDSLNQKLPGSNIVYLDIYSTLLSVIQNPSKYGFEVVNKGCCGTGNIEVAILCNRLDDFKSCQDPTKYVFWDSYHPTEAAYRILVNDALSKYAYKFL